MNRYTDPSNLQISQPYRFIKLTIENQLQYQPIYRLGLTDSSVNIVADF